MNKKLAGLVILALIFLHGCKNKTDEMLSSAGLLGQHYLANFKISEKDTGNLSGNFFLGSGGFNGSSQSFDAIQFAWSPKQGHTIVSSLPISKIEIFDDSTVSKPTIEFYFSPQIYSDYHSSLYIFFCSRGKNRKYFQPNDAINPNYIIKATVRISPTDHAREKFLP